MSTDSCTISLRRWRLSRADRKGVREAAARAAKEGPRDYKIKTKSGAAYVAEG